MVPITVKEVRVSVSYEACMGTVEGISYTMQADSLMDPTRPTMSPNGADAEYRVDAPAPSADEPPSQCPAASTWYIGKVEATLHMVSGSGGQTWTTHWMRFQWNPCDPTLYGLEQGGGCRHTYTWVCDRANWLQNTGPTIGAAGSADYHAYVPPKDYHTDWVFAGAQKESNYFLYGPKCEQQGDLPWTRHVECSATGTATAS